MKADAAALANAGGEPLRALSLSVLRCAAAPADPDLAFAFVLAGLGASLLALRCGGGACWACAKTRSFDVAGARRRLLRRAAEAALRGPLAAMQAAQELAARQKRPAGCFLMNCAGGMNQKGLMADDWRLVLASPFFALIEAILQSPLAAGYFRNFATDRNVRTILQKQACSPPPPRGVRGCVGY